MSNPAVDSEKNVLTVQDEFTGDFRFFPCVFLMTFFFLQWVFGEKRREEI